MPVTIRSGSTSTSDASTGVLVTETSGTPTAGDERWVFVTASSSATVTVPNTGWVTVFNTVSNGATVVVAYKVYVPGVGTETISFSGNTYFACTVIALTGRDTATAPTVVQGGSTTAGTSLVAPSVTPTSADGVELCWFTHTRNGSATTGTLSTPSGLTLVNFRAAANAVGYLALLCSRALTSTAATPTYTSTGNASGTYRTTSMYLPAAPTVTQSNPRAFAPFFGATF